MKKINKGYIATIILCAILVIGICAFLITNHKDNTISDALKFKQEYEAYNSIENGEIKYKELEINEINPIIYKTGKEILDILENETAIIYFGFAGSHGSRLVIETILEIAKEKNVEKIYYVDISDMRDEYKFNGTFIPEKIKNGTSAYYNILKFLDKYLEEYYIRGTDGNLYDANVKRLIDPTVVAVRDGEIKGFYAGVLENHFDLTEYLNEEELSKLKNKYIEVLESIN